MSIGHFLKLSLMFEWRLKPAYACASQSVMVIVLGQHCLCAYSWPRIITGSAYPIQRGKRLAVDMVQKQTAIHRA